MHFLTNGGSRLEPEGGGHRPLHIVARLPNLVVLLTYCGQLILRKKVVNLIPPDVRF